MHFIVLIYYYIVYKKKTDKYYIYTSSANKFNITQIKISSSLFYTYIKRKGELTSGNKDISSFKLKVTGLDYDKFYLAYYYLNLFLFSVSNFRVIEYVWFCTNLFQ